MHRPHDHEANPHAFYYDTEWWQESVLPARCSSCGCHDHRKSGLIDRVVLQRPLSECWLSGPGHTVLRRDLLDVLRASLGSIVEVPCYVRRVRRKEMLLDDFAAVRTGRHGLLVYRGPGVEYMKCRDCGFLGTTTAVSGTEAFILRRDLDLRDAYVPNGLWITDALSTKVKWSQFGEIDLVPLDVLDALPWNADILKYYG